MVTAMRPTAVEYRFGPFRLQPAARRLSRDDAPVSCPRRVFDLLLYLVEHRDRAVGRDELVAAVWGRVDVTDMQLGQIVLRARRAVDDDGTAQHSISTVAGFGYHWVAATQEVAPRAAEPDVAAAPAADAPQADAVPAPAPSAATSRPRPWLLAAAAVVVAVVGVLVWRFMSPPSGTRADGPVRSVVILPLRASERPDEAWVRLGGMDLVAERLRAGGLAVPTSESVLTVLRAADGRGDARDALRTAFGDAVLINGEAAMGADGQWMFKLTAAPDGGVPLPVSARRGDALDAARAATDLMLAALGREPPGDPTGPSDGDEDWQRARAALLADETATARRILTGSARLAEQPDQLAIHLALVDYSEGKLAAADAAMTELLARLPRENGLMRMRALTLRGSVRIRLGDFAAAWVDYDAALAAAPREASMIERARALGGRGAVAVPSHRFEAALADMGEARALHAAAGDVLGAARVDANLGMLEMYRARPASALQYLDAASDRMEALGAQHEWQVVAGARLETHLALLQYDDADEIADRAWERRERSKDPEQQISITVRRAHVRIHTGRYREAAALLADPQNDTAQGLGLRAQLATLRAELALRQARWDDAVALADAAIATWPPQGGERMRDEAELIRVRALLALGRTERARAIALRAPVVFMLPADDVWRELGRAAWFASQHDDDAALAAYRASLAAAEQSGAPVQIAAVAAAAVPVLLDGGRVDEARRLAGRVASWSDRDYDCALVQLYVLHATGARDAWTVALATARRLAGEREIPEALQQPPGVS